MAEKPLTNAYLSVFALELAMLLQAGVTAADGLRLMAEDDDDKGSAALLAALADEMAQGAPLSAAMAHSRRFPAYLLHMTEVGERAGRLEECLRGLSAYYDGAARLQNGVRQALLSPLLLLAMVLAVLVVLIVKVLPVFADIYAQLGSGLHGLAAGLLRFGSLLTAAAPYLAALLGLLLALALLLWLRPALRAACLRRYCDWRGMRGLSGQLAETRLAAALAMALQSGLNAEEALELATPLAANSRAFRQRCAVCAGALADGHGLAESLARAELFPAAFRRMLALAAKSGALDTTMAELARRLREQTEEALDRLLGRVEPAMVIGGSLLAGIVLLSVMLPLLDIMTALG